MRIAVTGGAGFIGSRLCEKLREQGQDVLCLDRVPAPADLRVDSQIVDVLDLPRVEAAIRGAGALDAVYHLAGPVVEGVRKQPAKATELQILGTTNVLEAVRLHARGARVLLASSFYVYAGCGPDQVVNEETVLDLREVELFGALKLMAERLVTSFAKSYGLRYGIFRFGSVYGFSSHAAGSNVIRTFLEQGFRKEPITVWGPGRRRNQYTYIDDVVEALANALSRMVDEPAAFDNQTWTITSPYETTTGELAALLSKQYGFEFIFDEDRPEGPSMAFMVPRKAVTRALFTPTRLDDGVRETVRAMQKAGVLAE